MSNIDETLTLSLKYDSQGLVPAIAQDAITKDILMLAWMNEESLQKTLQNGEAHYWSRSRQELWHKGASSGAVQIVNEIRVDCDQDALILLVTPLKDGACHTGRPNCFYRSIVRDENGALSLRFSDTP